MIRTIPCVPFSANAPWGLALRTLSDAMWPSLSWSWSHPLPPPFSEAFLFSKFRFLSLLQRALPSLFPAMGPGTVMFPASPIFPGTTFDPILLQPTPSRPLGLSSDVTSFLTAGLKQYDPHPSHSPPCNSPCFVFFISVVNILGFLMYFSFDLFIEPVGVVISKRVDSQAK